MGRLVLYAHPESVIMFFVLRDALLPFPAKRQRITECLTAKGSFPQIFWGLYTSVTHWYDGAQVSLAHHPA